ncbi:MAG: hypothetical protein IBX63_05920 [Coriobacteriia bacterium]|nr:hypothetical protein [Coriobacteriia bacterium]
MQRMRRVLVAGAAVIVLMTVFALGAPLSGIGSEQTGGIDLTAEVRTSTCAVCHTRIAESRSPGLVFSHATHLVVGCTACHVRSAHEAGNTYSPPMVTCFACHGLVHGVQGVVATGSCDYCHTPIFELRPEWHTETWAERPHADAAVRGGTNGCILCHDPRADCDACHTELAVDTPRVPPIYLTAIPAPEPRPSITVDPTGPTSMGQCIFCHPVIDREWPDLIFAHDTHLRRDYHCEVCHESFPHRPGQVEIPTMISCYRCHSLIHSVQGEVASEECLLCHPPAFELVPADHTPAFIAEEHAGPANEDLPQCAMCHASTLCSECHRGELELADGAMSAQVIPADHQQAEWIADHGGIYLGGQGVCSICHTPVSCIRCHFTPMPHPTAWLADHTANSYPRDDCKVCHQDRTSCQECHHEGVRDLELVAENCIDCHPVMATEPPTDIKEMGFAEHAVHFGVEERIGRPYICDDCHVGFTVARVREFGTHSFSTQAHDLRICYDCHGNIDYSNIEIAPWPGSQLCRRCHLDLNI